jgi:hypothetical protein
MLLKIINTYWITGHFADMYLSPSYTVLNTDIYILLQIKFLFCCQRPITDCDRLGILHVVDIFLPIFSASVIGGYYSPRLAAQSGDNIPEIQMVPVRLVDGKSDWSISNHERF